MRRIISLVHRWIGLAIAAFLFVSGITGAVISWDHELDDALNPHLMHASTVGEAAPVFQIVKRFETENPAAQVTYFRLAVEKGESGMLAVQPRVNAATGQLYDLNYNQVYFDSVTGSELGRRKWGAVWPITRETFVSFLYRLHYTLHIPRMWSTDRVGYWLMGAIALIWAFDCFFGFYLTLPARRAAKARSAAVERELGKGFWARWKPAWKVKTTGSAYRINFDLHRAFGLWTWVLLFVIAFTGFSLNLYREVFYPIMTTVSQVTPNAFMKRTPTAIEAPIAPVATYEDIHALAIAEARARGWTAPVGNMFYARRVGLYGVTFFAPEDSHGVGGVGHPALYYDGRTAALEGDKIPWQGTAADIFLQAQFPLHSGRILGLPGRILISIMGLVVAMLSVTGAYIWYRKRAARIRQQSAAYAVRLAPAE